MMLSAPPYRFVVEIPGDIGVADRYGIAATGLTAANAVLSCDPVDIDVEWTDPPVRLQTQLRSLYFDYVGDAGHLIVYASTRTSSAGVWPPDLPGQRPSARRAGAGVGAERVLLVANNDTINPDPNQPSEIVEFTIHGEFVKEISVDPAPGGSFGLAVHNGRFGFDLCRCG